MKIKINGLEVEFNKPKITFEEIAHLASIKGNPVIKYTCPKLGFFVRSGQVTPGEDTKVDDGMMFTVKV